MRQARDRDSCPPRFGWRGALRSALDDLGVREAAAIGICGQVNTHVFVDVSGRPVCPAIAWQDTRPAPDGAELGVDASHPLARMAWLARVRPEAWTATRAILSPKDYLNLRLCGELATDPISPIGLVGPDGAYRADVDASRLPPLRAPTDVLGRAGEPLPGAVVVCGTMDAWGNLYGSGIVGPGGAMEVSGTSEIVAVLSAESRPTPGVVSFLPVDGLVLHAGPTQAGGDALRWLAGWSGLGIDGALAAAARAPAGSRGAIFLPYLAGERAPLWDASARGVFFGLTAAHGLEELARAVLEGVAFSARHLLEACEQAAGLHAASLRLSGGASRSDLWSQIKADVHGRPLERLETPHTGLAGAALLAGVGAGLLPSLREAAPAFARVGRVFDPQPGPLDELYALYRELYPALRPLYERAAATKAATSS